MEFHSIANVWPMMEDDALQALADDIRQNGLLNPIWTYQGKVLDGRNRLTACRIAQVEPQFREYKGDEPTAFAVSLNDKRRHMTKSALAAVAAELEPMFAEDAKRRQKESGGDRKSSEAKSVVAKMPQPISEPAKARDEAAKSVGVGGRYVQDAKRIKTESPETFERMKAGKISIQDAKRAVARIPTDDWTANERQRQRMVESGVAVVANQQADKNLIAWAEENGLAVRIDRGSKYGNPFVMGHDGDRDAVCEKYAEYYVPHKPSILKDIAGLAGKVLVCHCYPERCHGDTLQELAMEAAEP